MFKLPLQDLYWDHIVSLCLPCDLHALLKDGAFSLKGVSWHYSSMQHCNRWKYVYVGQECNNVLLISWASTRNWPQSDLEERWTFLVGFLINIRWIQQYPMTASWPDKPGITWPLLFRDFVFRITDWTSCHGPILSCYTKDNLKGRFRRSNSFSLRRLGPGMNHLPPAWQFTFQLTF